MKTRFSTLLVFLSLLTVTVTALSGVVRASDDSNQTPCGLPPVNCNMEEEDKTEGSDEVVVLYGTLSARSHAPLCVTYRKLNDVAATSIKLHGRDSTRAPPIFLS